MEELSFLSRSLIASGRRFVFGCVCGASGPAALLSQPGASATMLEVTVPYARRAFLDYIAPQPPPPSFASAEAALCLARSSLSRARRLALAEGGLASPRAPVFGVGSAGALASLAPKAGDHRCHVALCSEEREELWELRFAKGARERASEEALCGAAVLGVAAGAGGGGGGGTGGGTGGGSGSGLPEGGVAGLLERCGFGGARGMPGDALSHRSMPCAPPLQRLVAAAAPPSGALGAGEAITHLLFTSPTHCQPNAPLDLLPQPLLVLPGSFNPLHAGHLSLAAAALARLAASGGGGPTGVQRPCGVPPAAPTLLFELSMHNVDKAPLEEGEVVRRVGAFFEPLPPTVAGAGGAGSTAGGGASGAAVAAAAAAPPAAAVAASAALGGFGGVLVTRAPRFIEKAALCRGAAFVLGWDTASRLISPAYYGGGEGEMREALGALLGQGCRMLVAGRRAGAAPLPQGWAGPQPASGEEFLTLTKHLAPAVPPGLLGLFLEIPEAEFSVNVSSREIRERAAALLVHRQ